MRTVVWLGCALLLACGSRPPRPAPASSSSGAEQGAAGVEFGSIDAAIAGSHRSAAHRARDRALHPRETLSFFGIASNQRVVELWPDDGWLTELLAPVVHDEGALIAALPEGPTMTAYLGLLQSAPAIYDRVETVTVAPQQPLAFGAEASADVVLTLDDFHPWLQARQVDQVLMETARVLKPGGVYGVVQHRARPGTPLEAALQTGYVPEELVIEAATKAGLVLEARSQINANPGDPKDHPAGVWTLPPYLRLGAQDRARYQAIGESDRMTLRFRKPSIQ